MRAFSPQRRHRSLPDVFVQLWRRWMATGADQLLETARLGSDKLDYLTHNPKASDADLCTRRAAALTTCCGAACSPSNSIPLKWLFRIPLYFVIFRDAAGCARAAKIVRRI